jgi:nicotinamide mononucleotide transporter
MSSETSSYGRLDLVWLVLLTFVGSILSVVLATSIFDLSVFLSGLLCVGLIAIGRREGYLAGLYRLQRAFTAAVCIVCTVGLGLVLRLNPNQNTPFIDATTNVVSVVATFLMMWRYKEQWLLYILLNVITIIMWLLRVRAGGESGDLMVLMWSLFLLNAVFGYWRWHKGAKGAAVLDQPRNAGSVTCDVA